ncbi:MAG: tRNA epoxyqueuosine(34) reductase QueG [Alphaproteobacteria bacterium]
MTFTIKQNIIKKAYELGFDDIGFTIPELSDINRQHLVRYKEKGYGDEMPWLVDDIDKRSNPKKIWENVKSVICLAVNIKPNSEQEICSQNSDFAQIAFHAQGKDYHKVIKKRLIKLGHFIKEETGADFKAFVDTAPVMEKPLAEQAGIGWQGRHSLIVSKKLGTLHMLGELFVDIAITPDSPSENHCGTCKRCVDACPTAAISIDSGIDVLKCIAFHTIENKGDIPDEVSKDMGSRIYGCDACAKVCPFNKFNQKPGTMLEPRLFNLRLDDLAQIDESEFNKLFQGTGVKRIGFLRFKRNLQTARKNNQKSK